MGNDIPKEVKTCRKMSGCYSEIDERQVVFLIKSIDSQLKKRSLSNMVKRVTYEDKFNLTGSWQVVQLRYELLISTQEKKGLSVFAQVLFPPRFPLTPPVFSVKNPNQRDLLMHKEYSYYPLPGETFEVKLIQSDDFKRLRSTDTLVQEFLVKITLSFPYFKGFGVQTIFPRRFDERYNDPNVNFPFGRVDALMGQGPRDDFSDAIDAVQGELLEDLDTIRQLNEFVTIERGKVDFEAAEHRSRVEGLQSTTLEVRQATSVLDKKTNFFKELTHNPNYLSQLVAFEPAVSEQAFVIHNELKGLRKTIMFLEDAAMTETLGDARQLVEQINRLYRKECDIKLKELYLEEKV